MLSMILLLALSIQAAPSPEKVTHKAGEVVAGQVVYPPPPDAARIRLLKVLRTPQDLKGSKGSSLGKIVGFFTGGDAAQPILKRPYGVAAFGEKVYVADSEGGAIYWLDLQKAEHGKLGTGKASVFTSAIGIAVDPKGNVYASDSAEGRIKAFSPQGEFLWESTGGEGDQKLARPTGLAWTPKNEVLVLDTGNHRIVTLAATDGKFLKELGRQPTSEGYLPVPTNVWVRKDGSFLVTDPMVARVHVFSPEGKYVSGFGEHGDTPGYMSRPRGVAVDSDGNIHVADALFNLVQMFTPEGELLMYYGGHGPDAGSFMLPAGVFIDAMDRIIVADSTNRRVEIFEYIKSAPAAPAPVR